MPNSFDLGEQVMFFHRWLIVIGVIATMLTLVTVDAQARIGGGFSSGSRGMRTFSAPPLTRTAPNAAAPIGRSFTQPSRGSFFNQSRPGLFGGGFFGRGLFGGLAAGFLGAGLFGLLFGHGFFGGMGGFASLLGLMLQLAVIYFVARLIWSWWQSRNIPAYASRSSAAPAGAAQGYAFGTGGSGFGANSPQGQPIEIVKSDYDTFERLLSEIQSAYSSEDLNALRARATPEMLSYFSEELAQNASRGLVNQVSGVRLLQGDLAEAWSEGATEYATVAMRFALVDRMIESASGRAVSGGEVEEVTELWTFMRVRGGQWLLSAIQQT
jgi:predicted lipid-binding transport protein (Tim44 family)